MYYYGTGTAGTEVVPAGGKVTRIWALGAAAGAASLAINGLDSLTIPEGKEVNLVPQGHLGGTTATVSIVFTSTQSYLVEWYF